MLRDVVRRRITLPGRGVDIALIDWGGAGPLAFLHHANGFCAALWDLVAERLRPHYRVIALDARGHGDSSTPPPPAPYHWENFIGDLIAVVERVLADLGRARVDYGIGHSFGGTTTAMAAARRPELYARIGMLDPVIIPPPEMFPPDWRGERPPMAEIARKRRGVWPSRQAVVEAWTREGHAFDAWDRRALELYAAEGFRDRGDGSVELKCRGEVEAAVYENNQSIDPFREAANLRAPVLLARAARGSFPRAIYEAYAARIRDVRIEEIDAGHLLPMEAPDATAEALLRFGRDA